MFRYFVWTIKPFHGITHVCKNITIIHPFISTQRFDIGKQQIRRSGIALKINGRRKSDNAGSHNGKE